MENTVKVYCNWQWRTPIYGYELTTKERKEFDYISDDDIGSHDFLRYRGNVYDLSEFMRIDTMCKDPNRPSFMQNWHGYTSDSFFSGVLIKWNKECDQVMIATYIS